MHPLECSRAASSSSSPSFSTPDTSPHEQTISSQQCKIPFLRDAEKATYRRPTRITRQSSCPELGKGIYTNEGEEIKKRSCHLWDCIGRRPNPNGGYIYQFKTKPEYDYVAPADYQTKLDRKAEAERTNKEIYPGIEIGAHIAIGWDPNVLENSQFLRNNLTCKLTNAHKIKDLFIDPTSPLNYVIWSPFSLNDLLELGYRGELVTEQKGQISPGIYFELPDRDALLANWQKMQERKPELPDISIPESAGIAGDLEFITAFLIDDGLLSNGVEFLHDHTIHLSRILTLIFNSNDRGNPHYSSYKFFLARTVLTPLRTIWIVERELDNPHSILPEKTKQKLVDFLPKIQGLLGHYVDLISSLNEYKLEPYLKNNFEDPFYEHLQSHWDETNKKKTYWKRRFGINDGDFSGLRRLWDMMERIEISWLVGRKLSAVDRYRKS